MARGNLELAACTKLQAEWLREKGHRYTGAADERAEWEARKAAALRAARASRRSEQHPRSINR